MVKVFFSLFLILFSISITAMTWEFGMRVVSSSGSPIRKEVKIYKIVEGDLEFDYLNILHRTDVWSKNFWEGAVNFAGDFLGDGENTSNPSYAPALESGDYRIRIGDRYCILHIPTDFPSSPDFIVLHQNENFSFWDAGTGGVTISETKDWDLPLIFGQKIENTQTDIGTVAVWDGISFNDRKNAPNKFYLKTNQIQFLHGSPEILSSSKFYRWDDENFIDVINPKSKDWNEGSAIPSIDALLKNSIPSITIQNNLDGTGMSAGELYFKDPWFMDLEDTQHGNNLMNRGMDNSLWWKRYPTTGNPFKLDYSTAYENGYTYKGVFLNQDPELTPTFYKVKVDAEQTIQVNGQNRKFYFFCWSGDPNKVAFQDTSLNQTGVVFKDANAIVSARLKGHLMSSSTNAISSNSQRKMVRTDNGIYHVVYESMNSVIYTHSLTSNFEGEWAKDQVLGFHSKNPAIDYHGNIVKVVFEYYDPLYTTDTELWIYTFTQQANGRYENPSAEDFATCPSAYFGNAKPVIAYNNGQIFVAYRKNGT